MDTLEGESSQQLFSWMGLMASIPWSIVILIIILLLISGLVSGAEVAYFSLSSQQIKNCKESEDTTERRVYDLLQDPKSLLATILILNNLVNVAIVTLATYASWTVAEYLQISKDNNYLVLFLTVVVTALVVFFGEIVPKVYATQKNLAFAKFTVGFLSFSNTMLKPLAKALTGLGDFVERRLAKHKKSHELSVTELSEAVNIVTETESEHSEELLKGIVNFGSKTVTQIMQSRMDIEAVENNIDFHQLMDRINKSGFSRIPVFSDTIDNIIGIIYIKDLLPFLEKDEKFSWQALLRREVFFVPESKKIDELLRDFQQRRVHMAIIVDEYGGTTGLVTMEDIIEEIVGDINDEFDDVDDVNYERIDDSTLIFDGKTSLIDFCKIANIENATLEKIKGESESLGGLLLELFEKMPNTGEMKSFENMRFTVMAVSKKRIKTIKVHFADEQNEPKDGISENAV